MKNIFFLFLTSILIFSCGNSGSNKKETIDDVVHDIGNWDRFVIPLKSPYEIINSQQEKNTWLINMYDKRKRFQFSITPVEQVGISENIIFVKGGGKYGKTSFYGKMTENIYFVLYPETKIEIGFEDSLNFNKYLDSLNVRNIKWFETNDLYKYYQVNKKLPWD